MENSTRLLQRHADTLAQRRWLMINAEDPAATSLPGLSRTLVSDVLRSGMVSAMLPELPARTDLLVVLLPKSKAQLQFQVDALAAQLSAPCELWLVGPARGGIKGGVTALSERIPGLAAQDSARHCKLFVGQLAPRADFDADKALQHFQHDGLSVRGYPGVFSVGELDEGTALLLEVLGQQAPPASALDVGCGCGVISAVLARAGAVVTAVDVSATALASTRATLAANGLEAAVVQSNLFAAVPGRFGWIVTNPPFHDGTTRTLGISEQLIREAPDHLAPGGTLWLVANRNLPYHDILAAVFANVLVAARSNRFTVYRATL